jgi:cytoskeletal protein RodZ
MTATTSPRRSRRRTAIIIAVLVLVVAAAAIIGLLTTGAAAPAATKGPGSSAPVQTPAAPASSGAASPSTAPTTSKKPVRPSSASTPQPTRTATISSAAPIVRNLSATVSKTESVQGTASGPGEIAGPALRFTVRISNDTDKRVSLADTVVNVYTGKDEAPAVQLSGPGGKSFPASVSPGSAATGVFVFNVPKDQRGRITVTVDTSVANPVVAFTGSAR